MSDRVSVIDAAVGALQGTVERQQEEIDRLTEMVQCLVVKKFSDAEIEYHRRRCEEERDADQERGDY